MAILNDRKKILEISTSWNDSYLRAPRNHNFLASIFWHDVIWRQMREKSRDFLDTQGWPKKPKITLILIRRMEGLEKKKF